MVRQEMHLAGMFMLLVSGRVMGQWSRNSKTETSTTIRKLCWIITLAFAIPGCSHSEASAQIEFSPVDSTVIEENSDFFLAEEIIREVFDYHGLSVVMGYQDDRIAVREIATGRIRYTYIIPIEISDSLFQAADGEDRAIPGWTTPHLDPVYALPRSVLSKEEQALRLKNRINSIVFLNDSVFVINAEIAGMVKFLDKDPHNRTESRYITGPLWLRALLQVDFVHGKIQKLTPLPVYPVTHTFTYAYANPSQTTVVIGAADNRCWEPGIGKFQQYTLCRYDVARNKVDFVAPRDSGNYRFILEAPMIRWQGDTTYYYAHGNETSVFSSSGATVCTLPQVRDKGGQLEIRQRWIRGFQVTDEWLCVYSIFSYRARTHHEICLFDPRSSELLAVSELKRNDCLYAVLGDNNLLSVFVTKDHQMLRVRYKLSIKKEVR
jgi:hypothetical protein